MDNLQYIDGWVTRPKAMGPQIIGHICNDLGVWYSETARRISQRWPEAEQAFRRWYLRRLDNDFCIGAVQFVNVNRTHVNRVVRVANMVAKRGTRRRRGGVKYQSLTWCLGQLAQKAKRIGATIHLSKKSLDQLEQGWQATESLIRCVLCDSGINVFIYRDGPSAAQRYRNVDAGSQSRYEILDSPGLRIRAASPFKPN